ncbi:uncharacterized protein LOC123693385 [Colias croceus]|uniref:uncharacterized protein LOC123693385 n=1 Tax=Colias crocea TaxID=72248 RepID=UPI001E27ED57|nr:uncharacterized protein LOC123693385 [Colias croceus]
MFLKASFLIVVYSFYCTYAAAAAAKIDTPIKYPGPTKYNNIADDVPEACWNLTYCTIKPKNYPEEKFNLMFKGYKPLAQPSLVTITFDNRQGDPTEGDDCESEVTFEPLYKVREKREDPWQTVVQAPGVDYVQRVRLERCTKPDAPCFNVFSENSAYVTFCKQKYNKWEVLVENGEKDTKTIQVQLPVCCTCNYRPADMF